MSFNYVSRASLRYVSWFETGPESELTVFKTFVLIQMHTSFMADLHVWKKVWYDRLSTHT